MKKTFILIASLIFVINGVFSQTKLCSEYEANKKAEAENPEALPAKAALNSFTKEYVRNGNKTEEVYIIPIVFHVLHNYGSENISDAQILDALRILNEDFRKLNSDTIDIIPEFTSIAADSRIEFRLATIDPNGDCTNGIVRVATSYTYNADDDSKLQSPSWDRSKYFNVWTCSSIGSGAAGYSYYPSSVSGSWGASRDGVIILSTYTGSIGTGTVYTSRALTHEIGHYLNLAHTWGSTNEPGLLSNCDVDDDVLDTPNTIGHTSCDLDANTCGFLDNVQNYMEYAYCDRMFTAGQKDRMRATLNSPISGRNNLWLPSNLLSTGTNDGAVAQICAPQADFTYSKQYACNTLQLQYTNLTSNTDTLSSIMWSFPGGTPAISNDINPIITYSNPGNYSATLTVSNPAGTDQITKTNIIQIQNSLLGEGLPWIESFENSSFPNNPLDSNKNWTVKGSANVPWQSISGIAYDGQFSVAVVNDNNNIGQTSEMYSPNILFAGNDPNNYFTFRYAYAQKQTDNTDQLQVFVSFNCGQTWYPRFAKSGVALSTNGGVLVSSFIPDTAKWLKQSISLGIFMSRPNIRVKFIVTSGGGNEIYLDDINLEKITTLGELPLSISNNLSIYPNPLNEESLLNFDINIRSKVTLELLNVLGQNIADFEQIYMTGPYSIPLGDLLKQNIHSGIYFLKVSINGKTETIKLIKN
jgi:PKD repeat protein